jgi:aspartyl-tRNA(Asn)/glutamyl-tRNA(Gln) amidotransferase subunit C
MTTDHPATTTAGHDGAAPAHVNEDTVRKTAWLARVGLSEAEVSGFTADLQKMLGYVAQLEEVDVEGVAPMVHATDAAVTLRADDVDDSLTPADVTEMAPSLQNDLFVVPRVISAD